MDVGGWLKSLGLECYETAFRENDVDAELLPRLTGDDLKDLGITSVGHRRRLLDAVAKLHDDNASSQAVEPLGDHPASTPAEEVVSSGGERRQLTVMFCDLVGSTALSEKLDPEELRDLLHAYRTLCGDVIARYDGFVARYVGDGILTYFGWPAAHEEDAERAVRTALEVVQTVKRASTTEALSVRLGIATGPVVVGEPAGVGDQAKLAVGSTPNLAARLQGLAAADQIVIAASTCRLVGNAFDLSDLGEHNLKGIAEPVHAWRVDRVAVTDSRFDAHHSAAGLTPLVGRDEEVDLLLRRWAQARDGEGQVVLLGGEPGIGKSRILSALRQRLDAASLQIIRFQCSPYSVNSALWPVIDNFERTLQFTRDETTDSKLDKLDALLAQTATSPREAALIAEMLSLPNDGRYPALELTPEQRRHGTLEALMAQLAGLARQQPVLMIFEDVHWIDPTSLEMLARIVERIKTLPALLIVTFRPEFNAPWVGQSRVTSLTLNRLAERQAAAIVARLAGNKELPADVITEIVERTDGIPLFVEEMTKAVLEAASEDAIRRTVAAMPSPVRAVPASLHASLMARLDRLGPAKEVAQIGSAIGREFPYTLLASVARKPEAELQSSLDSLIQAGLLYCRGVPPQASYLFKHALVQDAAHGTLLREPRRALHTRIAEILESQFAEIIETRPELLAHHCTEAGLIEKAAGLWGKAAEHSLARSALAEAAAQFTRALEQIASLPGTPALRREQIRLQVALITPLIHVKGYAAAETKATAERAHSLIKQAEALGEPLEDPLLLFSVLYAFWVANLVAFNGAALCDLATQFLALAGKQAATVPLMIAHRLMGLSLLHTMDAAGGREHLDQAIALYDPTEHRKLAMQFGQDTRVTVLTYRSWAQWLLGYPEAALRDANDALRHARDMGQAATLMLAVNHIAILQTLCGNLAAATAHAQEVAALAKEGGSLFWKAGGMMNQGSTLALIGRASEAIEILSSGITAWQRTGTTFLMPFYLPHLARAHAELGQFETAWRCIDEAMTAAETTKEKWCEADIYRTAGEVVLMSPAPDTAKAEMYFERAIAIARERKEKSWELRTSTSLARLWQSQDKRQAAYELLAPVYDWFTEGFDTKDLQEAKSLLAELR